MTIGVNISPKNEKLKLTLNRTKRLKLQLSEKKANQPALKKTLYGSQFTVSIQLIKPNYLLISLAEGAPQFLKNVVPL